MSDQHDTLDLENMTESELKELVRKNIKTRLKKKDKLIGLIRSLD